MERKTYRARLEFKAGETGEFVARFATLGVVDHDGDVTKSGAFETGQETLIEAWNHNYGELPVGKAIIGEDDEMALAEGAFFLDTLGGQEHYRTVKHLGDLQEWSYTFRIIESEPGKFDGRPVRFLKKLDVIGVAPVDRGAGINTGTVVIKDGRENGKARAVAQRMHDVAVELGAECAGHTGAGDGGSGDEGGGTSDDGKAVTSSAGNRRSTLAARVVLGGWVRDSD